MRRLVTIIVFVVIVLAGMFAYGLVSTYTQEVVSNDPLVSLVKSITAPATPVILPDPTTIVREVNQLARLETASFSGEKVIKSERNTDQLWGIFGESLVFVAHGEVIAGIDLQAMEDGDIQVVDPTTVMVHLPDAEIFVATLDNQQSYVVDRDIGLFTGADPELETQVRQAGETAVLEAALEFGILQTADENAQDYMENFLHGLGFETVIFTPDTPPVPEPYVQEIPKGRTLTETPTP